MKEVLGISRVEANSSRQHYQRAGKGVLTFVGLRYKLVAAPGKTKSAGLIALQSCICTS